MIKKISYITGTLILTLASTVEAISFRDYYRGNAELGIPPHEKKIDDAVATGTLDLSNKELTDLVGFNEIPGLSVLRNLLLNNNHITALSENVFHELTALEYLVLNSNDLTVLPENIFHGLSALQTLYLGSNQLAALPENIFHGLTSLQVISLGNNQLTALPEHVFAQLKALQELSLMNNPIRLTQAELRNELQLPSEVKLNFKTAEQAQAEQKLFAAMKNADASAVRRRLDDIMAEKIRHHIIISKIRDINGDNLLHAAIRDAAERIGAIDKELGNIRRDAKLSMEEKNEANKVLLERKSEINDQYMKIISAILSCGEECIQNMLFTPNAEGQQVIDAVVAKLGFDSPIYKAILEGLTSEEAKEKKEKEQSDSGRVATQASTANFGWTPAHQPQEKEEEAQHETQK